MGRWSLAILGGWPTTPHREAPASGTVVAWTDGRGAAAPAWLARAEMTHRGDRRLQTAGLARVEGEGGMYVRVDDGQVTEVRLDIYEPPRFFEAFLRGRSYTEPPDITARICGICPVAYQTSACQAIETACGVFLAGQLADLRRLLYCGEWIASNALHIYLLHAPDFLGYPGAVELARDHREIVERGFSLRQAGNAIMELVGGRAIHPVNVRVGGFYRAPSPREPRVYPIERGTLVSSGGLAFAAADFERHVIEEHVPHSTALHARLADGADGADGTGQAGPARHIMTGPLARYTLNSRWLPPLAASAASAAGLGPACRNPFQSIVVRAVEIVCAVEEALRLIGGYQQPDRPFTETVPRAGVGHGVSEAPRGILYHQYELDADGIVRSARIVPPTSQNQAAIQADLREFVQARLNLDDERLTHDCEQAIRNYDPCISCAAHFLTLRLDRA